MRRARVDKQPGVDDVTKQYLYELSYKDFAEENNLSIGTNAFLLPTDRDEIHIGTASIDIFSSLGDIRLHDIEVILKLCYEMYEIYLGK
ncbi:LlaJI family restriction endonuclease [Peptostreptococcus stomatis]|uniref:LlaJI family restriction endonuclease n=1 Tax=Peptostreptococcus stomatis TaxID=341694 RepID=UPI003AB97680